MIEPIIAAAVREDKQAEWRKIRVEPCPWLANMAAVMLIAPLRRLSKTGTYPMRMLAYVLAIVFVIVAVMYYTMQADQLPTFMPGYMAGSTHVHHTHALAAAAAAFVLFLLGWFAGRRAA